MRVLVDVWGSGLQRGRGSVCWGWGEWGGLQRPRIDGYLSLFKHPARNGVVFGVNEQLFSAEFFFLSVRLFLSLFACSKPMKKSPFEELVICLCCVVACLATGYPKKRPFF